MNHIDAITLQRAQNSKFFTQTLQSNSTFSKGDTETMFNRMNHMGLAYLDISGSYIAKYMPFYTVTLV